MKEKFLICAALFCCCVIAEAQVCKISNSNDNVEVFGASIIDGSSVEVTVGNDSQDISANVTVEVEVTYSYHGMTKKRNYTGKVVANPNKETVIKIPILTAHPSDSDYKPSSVKVVGISGTKCL